ncbi:MAG: sigma-70 family RNA polymerase sigma factor [Acidobacteriota bacterium]
MIATELPLGRRVHGVGSLATIDPVRPDADLIRAVLADEPGADEEWVRRHRRLVIGLARRRYGFDREQAEEILQATVAALWADDRKVLRAWRGRGRFSTYLTVVVCRLCRRRAETARVRRLVEVPPVERSDAAPSPAERAAVRERQEVVRSALAELRPRDRLLISLRFFDDREPAEMAPLVGLSPGAVRKAVHDALGRLRRQVGERGRVVPFRRADAGAAGAPSAGAGSNVAASEASNDE